MKTLLTLLLGLVLGAVGYAWLLRSPDPATTAPAATVAPAAAAAGASEVPGTAAAAAVPAAAPAPAPVAASTAVSPTVPADPGAAASPPGGTLLLPVQGLGRDQLQDTFTDARSEGRVHDAIDILAPTGTPVLAVADGTVEKLFDSERGGLTVYQFEPGGRYCYYYAHLQRYADGLAEKQSLKRGQVIGYVGSTGNADPGAPHLHFEIHRLGPEKQWWKGESLNPYPVLHDGQPLD